MKALTACESLNCNQKMCFAVNITTNMYDFTTTRNLEANATMLKLMICIWLLYIFGKIIFTIFHNFNLQIFFWRFSVANQRFVNFLFQLQNMHFFLSHLWYEIVFHFCLPFLAELFFFDSFILFNFLFLLLEWLMTCTELQLCSCVHLYVCLVLAIRMQTWS